MSKFKVGDRVVCVDDSGNYHKLKKGRIYDITKIDAYHLYFKFDCNECGFNFDRFKLASEVPEQPQPQPDSIMSAFNAVHDAIAPLSSLDRRKVIHAVKVLLEIM